MPRASAGSASGTTSRWWLWQTPSCWTTSLEAYNTELDAGLFSTDIPEGYTEFKLADFIPVQLAPARSGNGG